ncbi:hypothetical protein F889_00964 [Acinetobacter colistiniresistens]|uniref:Uncharacterized protein n=1 Tax=Acinetobacter colistiniresistens TaxID=280145 RepID=N9R821_9GAMM|nr:hypothetical protein [Acinetobacter colistiniresistens]ENX35297.1 hypothetical protein F889_00964 [Acinetobacter colistiniresistens]
MVISELVRNLDREYELFIQSQSYHSSKNSEIQVKALFLQGALKAMNYQHTHLIPLGGGAYTLQNFNNSTLNINLFNTPLFKNKTTFVNWLSNVLHKEIYTAQQQGRRFA